MPAQWLTPVASMKNYAEAIKKLENLKPLYEIDLDNEITYFNNKHTSYDAPAYDLFFAYTKTFPIYDPRRERDNRKYLPDIRKNIFNQERSKTVPALTSLNYGRRPIFDQASLVHNRRAHMATFYRRQRVVWGPEETRFIEDVEKSL